MPLQQVLKNALKSILYYNDTGSIKFRPEKNQSDRHYRTGTPSNDAFAYFEVQELTKLDIDLGPDTHLLPGHYLFVGCLLSRSQLSLEYG